MDETQAKPIGIVSKNESIADPAVIQQDQQDLEELPPVLREQAPFFERFLFFWVVIGMLVGMLIGTIWPKELKVLSNANVADINIPMAVLIWFMVLPAMLQVRLAAIIKVFKNPAAVCVTLVCNWALQPFFMYAFARFFFEVVFGSVLLEEQKQKYLTGLVILGGSPCTAMVFMWSTLVRGDATYTLVQVALNDIILLFLYTPTVVALLGISGIDIPWELVVTSVMLFVALPLLVASIINLALQTSEHSQKMILLCLRPASQIALLLVVVLIFAFQGSKLSVHMLIIALPLLVQTFTIFTIAYFLFFKLRVFHEQAAPGALIACSNFFELGVSVAISLYGFGDPTVLANVVGVLCEVPTMLLLVYICNGTRDKFPAAAALPVR